MILADLLIFYYNCKSSKVKKERKEKKEKKVKKDKTDKKTKTNVGSSNQEPQAEKVQEYDENNLASLIPEPTKGSLSDEDFEYVTILYKIYKVKILNINTM